MLTWNKVSKWACRWNVPAMKWLPLPRAELSPAPQSERLLVILPRSLSLCLSLFVSFFFSFSVSLPFSLSVLFPLSFRTFIFLLCCSLWRSFGSFHAFRPFSFATPPFPVSFPWACFGTSFCAFYSVAFPS